MKYIKSFNESRNDTIQEIRDFCGENLVYLKDEGFEYYTDLDIMADENEFFLYINGTRNVKFNDILPDFLTFIELLSEKVDINCIDVKFYINNDKFELTDKVKLYNYRIQKSIDELFDNKFNKDIYKIPSLISIELILKKKKVPFLNKVKSFFSNYTSK